MSDLNSILDLRVLDTIINKRIEIAVQSAIHNLINQKKENDDEFISRKEARKLLGGISNTTIIDWTKKGMLVGYRISGTVRYRKCEVLASLKKIQLEKLKQ
jgi:hypothetical protein